jgi:transposase InsO family protein
LKRTWGYRRLHELLEAEGFRHGLKRTYRLYIAEGLPVRRERAKTSRIGRVGKRVPPTRPNEVWEMVAVRVVLQNEQTYRAWRLGDAFTGELLDLQLDHLFRETPSTRAYDALLASQGPPTALWVDGDVCHLKSINGWASRNHLPVHRVPGRAAAFADVFPAEPFSLRREAEAGLRCNIKPYLEQS